MNEPPIGWSARYHDGRTAAAHDVVVALGDGALLIRDTAGNTVTTWAADAVRLLEPGDDGSPIRLARARDVDRLSIPSRAALASLRAACPHLEHDPYERRGDRKLLYWSVGGLAAFLLLLFWIVPILAETMGDVIPPAMEDRMGRFSAQALTRLLAGASGRCVSTSSSEALDRLMAPLIAQMRVKPHVTVIDTPQINAVALPGGYVLLFRGMIDFAQGPNEVAGVLAHEFGHVELHHPARVTVARGARSFLIGLALGDVLGGSAAAGVGLAALEAHYSREMEHQADLRALELLEGAHLDPGPFGAFFVRIAAKYGNNPTFPFLASHPPSEDRARLVAAAPPGGDQALSEGDWHLVKTICQGFKD